VNLVWLLPYTAHRLDADCQDPRGTAFVARRLAQIAAGLGAAGPADSGAALAALLAGTGFPTDLAGHGVTRADLPGVVEAALGSGRSGNGPIRLDPTAILSDLDWLPPP